MEHCSYLTDTGIRITDEVLETLADRQIPIGAALGVPPAALFANAPPAIKQMMERTGTTPDMVRAGRLDAVGRMYRAGVQFVGGADSGISSWRAHGLMRNSVATLVCHNADVRAYYRDGIVWVTLGEDVTGPELAGKVDAVSYTHLTLPTKRIVYISVDAD